MQNKDDSVSEALAAANSALTTPPECADEIFLEGPRSRFAEFFTLLRVMRDFLRGFRTLHFVGPCVTVFGSARIHSDDPNYELARKMGAAIARLGFTVMTGGGPGIMEAANRGAKDVGGRSVGCTISIAACASIIFSSAKRCWLSIPMPSLSCLEARARWTSYSKRSL